MVTGRGLDPWGLIPGVRRLTLVGRVLRADGAARAAYAALRADAAFGAPLPWGAARRSEYDALVLPGGHRARGMRDYLESLEVQQMAVDAFAADKPVGAICHGVLVAARAQDPRTERSVLHGRVTTALTWSLERKAWGIARWTRFWDANYYRTYTEEPGQREGFMSVQQEVTRALAEPSDFKDVTKGTPDRRRKTSGRARDSLTRCPSGLRSARRRLRLGPLAGGRLHVRPDVRLGAGRAGVVRDVGPGGAATGCAAVNGRPARPRVRGGPTGPPECGCAPVLGQVQRLVGPLDDVAGRGASSPGSRRRRRH